MLKRRTRDTRSLALLAALGIGLAACAETPFETQTSELDPVPSAAPADTPDGCMDGVLPGGALYRICVPEGWTPAQDLVVYAPGYQSPFEQPRLRDDELVEGTRVSDLVTDLGYAFATTSFRDTGLVVPETWIGGDLLQVVARFVSEHGQPRHTYLTGASQGGLITVLALERYPRLGGRGVFDGGLAACGPYGDFQRQIDYLGDFRVVYDYYFADLIAGWSVWSQPPTYVDPSLVANWEALVPQIRATSLAHLDRSTQVLRVTGAPVDPTSPVATIPDTFEDVLWYHVFGTNDAMEKLGGNPFDNTNTWYTGSANDAALNAGVERFQADPAARQRIEQAYQTTGNLVRPVVTLHTLWDPVVPHFHQRLYRAKARPPILHTGIPIPRYGHCNFEVEEVLAGFAVMVFKATAQDLLVPASLLPSPRAQETFLRIAREQGANPRIVRR
jgi:hypothetical protein